MKTSLHILLAALAATAMLAGCAKEITPPSFENDKVNPEGSRVIAVSFAPQTKTTLDGFQPKFEDKDSILISNGNAIDTCEVKVESEAATISTNLTGPLTAVYPYKAAKMNGNDENLIDTVLVSTEQDGTFASANICMARMTDENEESLSFENKTAVFCIKPAAGASPQYLEVIAEGFDIANYIPAGLPNTDSSAIRVAPVTTDSVYVSILVPDGLTIGDLKFSDGTNEKAITTGDRAAESIAAGTLYTVTNANWESTEADIPDGALKGVFSVSTDKQVQFSRGNLRYVVDTQEWGFYEHQYDFCNTTVYAGHHADTISLFTWGYNATKSIDPDGTEYVSGHDTEGNKQLNPSIDGDDWGVAYCGSNGIDVGTWRTLSTAEWQYLFNYGDYTSEIRENKCRWATVNGVGGYVIAPDGFTGTLQESYANDAGLADAGNLVFLPAAGYRGGSSVDDVGGYGFYWSSTADGGNYACRVDFASFDVRPDDYDFRDYGFSVRLITESN